MLQALRVMMPTKLPSRPSTLQTATRQRMLGPHALDMTFQAQPGYCKMSHPELPEKPVAVPNRSIPAADQQLRRVERGRYMYTPVFGNAGTLRNYACSRDSSKRKDCFGSHTASATLQPKRFQVTRGSKHIEPRCRRSTNLSL